MEFQIKKRYAADVVVAGGGTAGVFAAISAARTGAKTVLIEKKQRFGRNDDPCRGELPGSVFRLGQKDY